MKITEDCIDHNALRMIDDVLTNPWDGIDGTEASREYMIMDIGYVRGVLDFAKKLKEVLKA